MVNESFSKRLKKGLTGGGYMHCRYVKYIIYKKDKKMAEEREMIELIEGGNKKCR